ncbi:hypothetical protein [Nocardiopsis chromatogenes]|nr:hypothetical protein [Nocardiopsis chromatogenes]
MHRFSPVGYSAMVVAGIVVFGGIPLVITRLRKPSRRSEGTHVEKD